MRFLGFEFKATKKDANEIPCKLNSTLLSTDDHVKGHKETKDNNPRKRRRTGKSNFKLHSLQNETDTDTDTDTGASEKELDVKDIDKNVFEDDLNDDDYKENENDINSNDDDYNDEDDDEDNEVNYSYRKTFHKPTRNLRTTRSLSMLSTTNQTLDSPSISTNSPQIFLNNHDSTTVTSHRSTTIRPTKPSLDQNVNHIRNRKSLNINSQSLKQHTFQPLTQSPTLIVTLKLNPCLLRIFASSNSTNSNSYGDVLPYFKHQSSNEFFKLNPEPMYYGLLSQSEAGLEHTRLNKSNYSDFQQTYIDANISMAKRENNLTTDKQFHNKYHTVRTTKVSDSNSNNNPTTATTRNDNSNETKINLDSNSDLNKNSATYFAPVSLVKHVRFGGYEIDTWYSAPYPEEYSKNKTIYVCEFCLKYFNSDYVNWRHELKCGAKHPPGDEIYRDGSISIFEVDGRKYPQYCQNLCLLAKMFLGSKTLYYDVEHFLFYVMTEYDNSGFHFAGYFSKEKKSTASYNLSCILTLPIHQRKGYGNFLIDFSYLLTRVEGKTGSPEKPLSDFGLLSYRNYWKTTVAKYFYNHFYAVCSNSNNNSQPSVSIDEISTQTAMTQDDVISALESLNSLLFDPSTGTYALRIDWDLICDHLKTFNSKNYIKALPEKLLWTPFIATPLHLYNEDKIKKDGNDTNQNSQAETNFLKSPDKTNTTENMAEKPIKRGRRGRPFKKNRQPIIVKKETNSLSDVFFATEDTNVDNIPPWRFVLSYPQVDFRIRPSWVTR